MINDHSLQIILAILAAGFSVTITLIGIIFSWLKGRVDRNEERIDQELRNLDSKMQDRLRGLEGEDREIRRTVSGLKDILLQHIAQRSHKGK